MLPGSPRNLLPCSKKKRTLYKRARRSNKAAIWEKYRRLNNSVKSLCNTARWASINELASDLNENENPKPFWKSTRRGTNSLVSLEIDNAVVTDDLCIAQCTNFFFSSVFTVEDYGNFPTPNYVVVKRLENINCSVNEVRRLLLKLKPNKSPGRDNIAPCVLRECASELVPSLTHILNKSFSSGLLPNERKWAYITPLHKKDSKSQIVFDRLHKFWQETGLINNNQFGFLKRKSTRNSISHSLYSFSLKLFF